MQQTQLFFSYRACGAATSTVGVLLHLEGLFGGDRAASGTAAAPSALLAFPQDAITARFRAGDHLFPHMTGAL